MQQSNSSIELYKTENGQTEISVKLENETVWLSQRQMAQLFDKDTDTIGLHLRNIYKSGELDEPSTTEQSSVVQIEGKRKVHRNVKLYNLDAIISVGFRVNSKRGIQFRIWANKILKEFIVQGYALNEKRLQQQKKKLLELQRTIKVLENVMENKELTESESTGLLKIITDYSYALEILDGYDYQNLKIEETSDGELYRLTYNEAIEQIEKIKAGIENSKLFGREKDDSFKSSISTIYQSFDGVDLYPSIEEKAANLLYFITKNHSFTDGNKRIAVILFLFFLEKNKILLNQDGNKRIADNALVAMTLMIAVSKPEEKDMMIKIVVNLINRKN